MSCTFYVRLLNFLAPLNQRCIVIGYIHKQGGCCLPVIVIFSKIPLSCATSGQFLPFSTNFALFLLRVLIIYEFIFPSCAKIPIATD